MRRFKKVEVGQRFQSIGVITGAPASTYEVQCVFRSRIDRLEYARLADIDDPTAIKSIAVSTLLNGRQFSLVC
ncbi:MAG: hypothetical protein ACLQJR_04520 [Stellaceae bacterium]